MRIIDVIQLFFIGYKLTIQTDMSWWLVMIPYITLCTLDAIIFLIEELS